MDEFQPQVEQAQQKHTHNHGGKGKKIGVFLLVIVLIAGTAFGAWWYRDMKAKDQAKQKDQQISDLQQKQTDLDKQLADAKKASESAATTTTEVPSKTTIDNIKAAITSKNYAAIKDTMSSRVIITIAASEGLGVRTPTQAVSDLKYLDSGTEPWDFELPAATIASYQSGTYGMYFPDGAIIGKSANNKVVAISFNGSGKIVGIFMATDAKLL